MPKNILIFSDGTGQAGGLTPDEKRSNVYKLFRATRCGPDTNINPRDQLAFYDPGLGSQSDGGGFKIGWWRWMYNVLSQATGLGITRNIIDCYAAILQMYEPGDRIYLFGFSRGAYTVRCLAGVLGLCGVPTQMKDGSPLKRDLRSVRVIASEAVKNVYQYGSSIKNDPLKPARLELARRFRADFGSEDTASAAHQPPISQANVVPYFVGVWDTVAALRGGWLKWLAIVLAAIAATAVIAAVITWAWSMLIAPAPFRPVFYGLLAIAALGLLAWYLATHVNLPKGGGIGGVHLSGFHMEFYDTNLNPRIPYARHAMSIDENRADFARVPWNPHAPLVVEANGPEPFKQVWFAGNHSDIGGSYSENESRLSDIALAWMVEEARALPFPIERDESLLRLYPACGGPQHDEVKAGFAGAPPFLDRWVKWKVGLRTVLPDAPLHPSVLARFELAQVLTYDVMAPYRPVPLENHQMVSHYYPKRTP